MRDLVSSGRFAQLSRLTRKALRLYEAHDLLRPVHTDPETHHRAYSLSQLEEARRIGQLRALGMGLADIREVLRAWDRPELEAHLQAHRERLERQASEVQRGLAALDALLHHPRPHYEVRTKPVEPQRALTLRAACAPEDSCAFIDAAGRRLGQVLQDALARPGGAPLARYHDEGEDAWEVEVCLPVCGDLYGALPAGVEVVELPGGTAAYTLHAGDCGGLWDAYTDAYAALGTWIHAHNRDVVGPPYEVYLLDGRNTADPADHRTEIAWLLR